MPRRTRVILGATGATAILLGILLVVTGLLTRPATPAGAVDLPDIGSPSTTSTRTADPLSSSAQPEASQPSGNEAASKSARSKTVPPKKSGLQKSGLQKSGLRKSGLRESVPTRVRIPAAQVDAETVKLGIGEDGAMETPRDPDEVGWFVGGHTPGGPGVAVLAGHVTWNGRETVFFELGRLQRGTQIVIDREDGTKATFAITRRSTFAKDAFPTKAVYKPSAEPELVLITCGGQYDADQHSYDSNVIAWAKLVSIAA